MKRVAGVVLVLPFVWEIGRLAWRAGEAWFDAWFAAQLRKAWRPRPGTRQ